MRSRERCVPCTWRVAPLMAVCATLEPSTCAHATAHSCSCFAQSLPDQTHQESKSRRNTSELSKNSHSYQFHRIVYIDHRARQVAKVQAAGRIMKAAVCGGVAEIFRMLAAAADHPV